MSKLLIAATIATLVMPENVTAQCIGSGAFRHCTDDSDNSYSINEYGNTTNIRGYNVLNGSSWNQTSRTIGNTTFQDGYSSDGGNWSITQQQLGGMTITRGYDSDGNYVSRTCTEYGWTGY